MTDAFEAEIDTYDGIDIEEIQRENLEYAGVTIQTEWRDNMRDAGYKNDGEAINDVTFTVDGDTVTIGGDVIQLIIGEYGRRPGAKMPPHEPIADWVHEQTSMPNKGETIIIDTEDGPQEVDFRSFVFLVRRGIADSGLPEYAFGRDAWSDSLPKIEQDLETRINRAIEKAEE